MASFLFWLSAAALIPQLTLSAPVSNETSSGGASTGARCCSLLSMSHNAIYQDGASQYNESLTSYWALQARVKPACFVAPGSAEEVSTVVQTLVNSSCLFAIKSGGHNPFPSNNINSTGVTIDLNRLSTINVATTNGTTVTEIGPGARWGQVYDYLTPQGLMVGGGRAGDVGVGGLIVGGGNSFFASKFGLVCDNVENFQVVLANGTIWNANINEHPDLWQALKGGSNNFGVVTRFDMTTFKSGNIWGGIALHPESTIKKQWPLFSKFTDEVNNDTSASLISFVTFNGAKNLTIVENVYDYTETVSTTPPIFDDFLALDQIPGTNTVGLRNLTSLTKELEAAGGSYDLFGTLTFENDPELMAQVYDVSQQGLAPFRSVDGMVWISMFQPFPTAIFEIGHKRGGNVLGLDRTKTNQIQFLLFVQWTDDTKTDAIQKAAAQTLDNIKALAGSKLNPWVYLNYALESQDVLGGYGTANVAKMNAVKDAYDPTGVFQKLVPGGYKLANAMPTS